MGWKATQHFGLYRLKPSEYYHFVVFLSFQHLSAKLAFVIKILLLKSSCHIQFSTLHCVLKLFQMWLIKPGCHILFTDVTYVGSLMSLLTSVSTSNCNTLLKNAYVKRKCKRAFGYLVRLCGVALNF